jgi:acetyltransferase-like isoleucine patch superfamily enzyme
MPKENLNNNVVNQWVKMMCRKAEVKHVLRLVTHYDAGVTIGNGAWPRSKRSDLDYYGS